LKSCASVSSLKLPKSRVNASLKGGWEWGWGEWERGQTFWICLFHFWTPIRTLTVFFMRPEETTTAFICRDAEAASFWMCWDILGVDWGEGRMRSGGGGVDAGSGDFWGEVGSWAPMWLAGVEPRGLVLRRSKFGVGHRYFVYFFLLISYVSEVRVLHSREVCCVAVFDTSLCISTPVHSASGGHVLWDSLVSRLPLSINSTGALSVFWATKWLVPAIPVSSSSWSCCVFNRFHRPFLLNCPSSYYVSLRESPLRTPPAPCKCTPIYFCLHFALKCFLILQWGISVPPIRTSNAYLLHMLKSYLLLDPPYEVPTTCRLSTSS
jgi:hypothetical protein